MHIIDLFGSKYGVSRLLQSRTSITVVFASAQCLPFQGRVAK